MWLAPANGRRLIVVDHFLLCAEDVLRIFRNFLVVSAGCWLSLSGGRGSSDGFRLWIGFDQSTYCYLVHQIYLDNSVSLGCLSG